MGVFWSTSKFKNTLGREDPTHNLSPKHSKNEQVFYSPPPNFEFEEAIKKHKKDKILTEECSLEHPQAQ